MNKGGGGGGLKAVVCFGKGPPLIIIHAVSFVHL